MRISDWSSDVCASDLTAAWLTVVFASEDYRAMTQQQNFVMEPGRTVVVIMDFQNGIVTSAARNPQQTLENAANVLAAARTIDVPVEIGSAPCRDSVCPNV